MNSFERITIEGYRRLFNVQVYMRDRPLTVMIGANGVGKTSLLEFFSLLAASANAQLANKISELGGLADADAARILKGQDLMVSINQCPELKAFINTILELCKVDLIP
jgi:predicted ATPase